MEISLRLKKILSISFSSAKSSHHEFFTPEHILNSALSFDNVRQLLEASGADVGIISDIITEYLKKSIPVTATQNSVIQNEPLETQYFQAIMNRAVYHCASSDKEVLDITDVLVSMTEEKRSYCSYSLRKGGVDRLRLINAITMMKEYDNDEQISEEDENQKFIPGMHTVDDAKLTAQKAKGQSYVQKFCIDLTEQARGGNIDVVVGRTEELERTIQVLCRRTKNNPLYVGDAGVGKTALTNGLALRIVQDKVPDALKNFSVYSLDIGLLLAGTKFRGDFEDRLKKIIDDLSKQQNSILFIDEIHMIIGAGTSGNSSMDAANLLKPILASGKIRFIGSTTYDEYAKNFEKDKALVRRFQKIDISEPSSAETLLILKGLREKYESYHGVSYSDSALKEAIDLSVQYLPDRRLPDKAIDIIDEAGSYFKIKNNGGFFGNKYLLKENNTHVPVVSTSVIRFVTAKIARIPIAQITSSEKEKLRTLEDTMKFEIFGQDKAVCAVVKAVKRARAGFNDPEKPKASFLFVGPTGVGKTELARTLSSILGDTLLRYDMSEYQEEYTVSRLIGSAPGYVGYESGGQLTEDIRKTPRAIVLFDEIEKAHPKIYNILLQVMDYGVLTDNQGRKADFRNCIIIMTSNAGASEMEKGYIGFGNTDDYEDEASLKEAIEKTFTPEFRNRLSGIITFSHLNKEIISNIAKKEIEKLSTRLSSKKVRLCVSNDAISYLAEKGYSREFGARNMARTIEEEVATPLTDEVLFGKLSSGGNVSADIATENEIEKLVFQFE